VTPLNSPLVSFRSHSYWLAHIPLNCPNLPQPFQSPPCPRFAPCSISALVFPLQLFPYFKYPWFFTLWTIWLLLFRQRVHRLNPPLPALLSDLGRPSSLQMYFCAGNEPLCEESNSSSLFFSVPYLGFIPWILDTGFCML